MAVRGVNHTAFGSGNADDASRELQAQKPVIRIETTRRSAGEFWTPVDPKIASADGPFIRARQSSSVAQYPGRGLKISRNCRRTEDPLTATR